MPISSEQNIVASTSCAFRNKSTDFAQGLRKIDTLFKRHCHGYHGNFVSGHFILVQENTGKDSCLFKILKINPLEKLPSDIQASNEALNQHLRETFELKDTRLTQMQVLHSARIIARSVNDDTPSHRLRCCINRRNAQDDQSLLAYNEVIKITDNSLTSDETINKDLYIHPQQYPLRISQLIITPYVISSLLKACLCFIPYMIATRSSSSHKV